MGVIAMPASAGAATTANPTSVDFGSLPVGTQSATQVVTLTQTCTSITCITMMIPDLFSPVISATSGFTQTSNCPTNLLAMLGIPQSCAINVSFVPNAVGQLTGLLSTGPGGPTVALNGAGAAPPSSSGQKTRKRKCKKKHHRFLGASAAKKKCKKRK
jgi:hypothetical protein